MKILVGMSGGTDSTFAALKLMKEGCEVEGAVLVMHEYTELEEARKVAAEIGIKLHVIDAKEPFINIIENNFAEEYAAGRTPNPCIICNERIKFRKLADYAKEHGFDAIATGHYARILKTSSLQGERYAVGIAADMKKDQSYMLYRLPQDILSYLVFPLSDLTKEEVRAISREEGLDCADKKDSQEICFLPDGGYAEFVESVKGKFPKGNFVDPSGHILGEHNGIIRYTVGQRKGLGISLGERAFVTKIDPITNEITLSSSLDGVEKLIITDVVFSGVSPQNPGSCLSLKAKVRYTAPPVPVKAYFDGSDKVTVVFDSPVKAAPGQSCVLYDNNAVALGGIIE